MKCSADFRPKRESSQSVVVGSSSLLSRKHAFLYMHLLLHLLLHGYGSEVRMADFPRWVPHHGLDSIAALSAYLRWKSEQTIDWQLTCIQHRDPPHSLAALAQKVVTRGVVDIPCRTPACHRCERRGGYTFRWMHADWTDTYNQLRRPGSLTAREALLV